MSGLWEEYSAGAGLTALNSTSTTEVFHNEVDDHVFASAPITIVDGIVTVITDTTDLIKVKLMVANELWVNTDLEALGRHERQNWYSWMCAAGPLVFRLRSNRTLYPEDKLWLLTKKEIGTTLSQVSVGMQFFMVRHQ